MEIKISRVGKATTQKPKQKQKPAAKTGKSHLPKPLGKVVGKWRGNRPAGNWQAKLKHLPSIEAIAIAICSVQSAQLAGISISCRIPNSEL